VRIALVDTTPRARYYPVGLLRLGAWRRAEGDECTLYLDGLPPAGEPFDEIWLSTVFTFDMPRALGMVRAARDRGAVARVGGIAASLFPDEFRRQGAEVHVGLHPEAERFPPDYSLLPVRPSYSIVMTQRGCVRKCAFCMVPKLEPEFRPRAWTDDLCPGASDLVFYDNNWFGTGIEKIRRDISEMRKLKEARLVKSIDFNQGLDCRLLTDEIADLMVGLPFTPIRFAFDGMQEDGHYQRAVESLASRGFKEFVTYVLYNFRDSPADFYYRIRESSRLSEKLGVGVKSFPMRFQPILEPNTARDYVGPKWTLKQRNGVHAVVGAHSAGRAIVSCVGRHHPPMTAVEEFEFWFGRSSDEFARMLAYPKLGKLLASKKGHLRLVTAQSEASRGQRSTGRGRRKTRYASWREKAECLPT
jgi:hypothetical protein